LGPFAEVRLHFSAGEGWASSSRNPKQKKAPQQRAGEPEPSLGSLRLKCISAEDPAPFKFFVIVGNASVGPFECCFGDNSVQEFPLGIDWRKHLEPRTGCLRLRVQTLTA